MLVVGHPPAHNLICSGDIGYVLCKLHSSYGYPIEPFSALGDSASITTGHTQASSNPNLPFVGSTRAMKIVLVIGLDVPGGLDKSISHHMWVVSLPNPLSHHDNVATEIFLYE